jgi:protein-L-isoaspartate(D-aspartate) O-methyltransferase
LNIDEDVQSSFRLAFVAHLTQNRQEFHCKVKGMNMTGSAMRADAQMDEKGGISFASARQVMVENQIRTFDVTDQAVLAAFESVPRENFVPAQDRPLAYLDRRIDLHGSRGPRSLLPPLILARLIQALEPKRGEKALDVLGGFGYSAAILATMGLGVTMLEADEAFTEAARLAVRTLADPRDGMIRIASPAVGLSAKNHGMDAQAGLFDVILLNGACEQEPRAFFPLLAEGGRLGTILRHGASARAHVFIKSGQAISPRPVFDAPAPVLPGFEREAGFVF